MSYPLPQVTEFPEMPPVKPPKEPEIDRFPKTGVIERVLPYLVGGSVAIAAVGLVIVKIMEGAKQ